MIKYLIVNEYPRWVISIAVHLKWGFYIASTWFVLGLIRYHFKLQSNYWVELAAVIVSFWWVLEVMRKTPHEWGYLFSPFRKPIELIHKIAKIKVW